MNKQMFVGTKRQQIITLRLLALISLSILLLASSAQAALPNVGPTDPCQDQQLLKNNKFAQACYWRSFLVDKKGNIPTDARQAAYAQVQRMRAQKPEGGGIIGASSWTAIGPGNIGGRIRSIVRHPTNPDIIWIGSVGGGVFRTTNATSGAVTWSGTNDFMANLAVDALVLDPSDVNLETLYAGTGEGFFNVDAIQGAGIYKTTNGQTGAPATWNQLGGTDTNDFLYVFRLALSSNGDALLAGTRTGLWLNPDVKGATTWTNVNPDGTERTTFVAFNPADDTKAVASGYGKAWYVSAGDARTTGATWSAATFTPALPAPGFVSPGRVELAYAPSDPSIIYAAADYPNATVGGGSGLIYKSADGGATYNQVANTPDFFNPGAASQGWYDNAVFINPNDPNFVVIGGPNYLRATDGATFSTVAGYGVGLHPDFHIILADPAFNNTTNKRVYAGNDGGIYVTDDISASPPTWTSLNLNLPITQFYSGVGHSQTGNITGGSQDNGTPGYTGDFNTWVDWTSGDGGYVAVDKTDAAGQTWFGEYTNLQISRSTTGFTPIAPDITGGDPPNGCGALGDAGDGNNALFIAPFILDPNNMDVMVGGGSQLWRSANVRATTPCWASIKAAVAGNPLISAIAVAQGDSNVIWVGYDNGRVEMTTNGGGVWTPVGSGTLPGRRVTRIAIDPANSNNVYVTFGGYTANNVWRTMNAGTNWTDISTGLPQVPAFTLAINPSNSNFLYVGTDIGIFDSQNGLAGTPTWSVNDGPANVSVADLSFMGTKLIAATHGRSMFMAETATLTPTTTTVGSSLNPSTFGQSVTFTATVSGTGGTPTGTVAFKDGGTTIPGCGTQALSSGQTTCMTSALSIGTHTITADYSGDSNFAASTGTLTGGQVVNGGNMTTTTTLTSAPNPSLVGQSVVFTATVTGQGGTPTGNVTFSEGGTTLFTGTLSVGVAIYSTSVLTVGAHSVIATYNGDANFNASASAAVIQTVNSYKIYLPLIASGYSN